jgi:AmmeMemoRadiSam system protein A
MLSAEQGGRLLKLARQVLEEEFGGPPSEAEGLDDLELRQHRGVFVTLRKQGMLRGCIGSLLGVEPLVDGVRRHTLNAALHDHRFSLLTAEELPQVQIEISVLTPPQPLEYFDGDDLLGKLRPEIDGVIIKKGKNGATFLPQVWHELPEPQLFLEQLCRKAGLPGASWRSGDLTVQTYQALRFAEEELSCWN